MGEGIQMMLGLLGTRETGKRARACATHVAEVGQSEAIDLASIRGLFPDRTIDQPKRRKSSSNPANTPCLPSDHISLFRASSPHESNQ
jgi:hypothetical protein